MAPITKPQRVSLTQHCIRSIRQYVSDNSLGPGARLPSMQEWAAQLGVSVVVVREALRALEALGAVDIQHGRGIFVQGLKDTHFLDLLAFRHPLDSLTVEEMLEIRAMLDLVALEGCIARATPEGVEKLERILRQLAASRQRPGAASDTHLLFHQAMMEASGNRLLESIGVPLLNTFQRLGWSQRIGEASQIADYDPIGPHAALVEAIKNRDFSHMCELVDAHLSGMCSRFGVFPCAGAPDNRSAQPCPTEERERPRGSQSIGAQANGAGRLATACPPERGWS